VGAKDEGPARSAEPRVASWGQRAILALVGVHLVLGVVAGLPWRSLVWQIPVLAPSLAFYQRNHLDQRWSMFSPPPRRYTSIFYAIQFPEGWTQLQDLEGFAVEQAQGRVLQPRGAFRLMVHLRSTNADTLPIGLTPTSDRAFFYQELSDYFCRGAGRIPGALTIRFYVVGKTPPPFFEQDLYGRPVAPAADSDFVEPLYEQSCAAG